MNYFIFSLTKTYFCCVNTGIASCGPYIRAQVESASKEQTAQLKKMFNLQCNFDVINGLTLAKQKCQGSKWGNCKDK